MNLATVKRRGGGQSHLVEILHDGGKVVREFRTEGQLARILRRFNATLADR